MFSALLLAEDDEGERLSDREVRDELMTLLLAGHETTATGLAWCFDLLLHAPAVHARALGCAKAPPSGAANQSIERYLDAVVKESLRVRPLVPGVGRVAADADNSSPRPSPRGRDELSAWETANPSRAGWGPVA